jgi:hypothetical protein
LDTTSHRGGVDVFQLPVGQGGKETTVHLPPRHDHETSITMCTAVCAIDVAFVKTFHRRLVGQFYREVNAGVPIFGGDGAGTKACDGRSTSPGVYVSVVWRVKNHYSIKLGAVFHHEVVVHRN